MASISAASASAVRAGLLDSASRSSAAMREASTPSGAISRVNVTLSAPDCAVAVMPPMVMCTARWSMPTALATSPMASRTQKAVSPDRNITAPKRRTTSRELPSRLIAGSAPLRGAHVHREDAPRSGALPAMTSSRLQPQHLGGVLADPLDQCGIGLEVTAIGRDHLLDLGHPVADQLLVEAVLQHVHHDPDGGRGAGRGAEQGDERGIGRVHDLGAELQGAGVQLALLDDLNPLAGDVELPVALLHAGIELAQRLEAMALALEHLADQVFLEREVVPADRQQRQDVVRPDRQGQVEQRAVLQELGREAGIGAEQDPALAVDDAGVEMRYRH